MERVRILAVCILSIIFVAFSECSFNFVNFHHFLSFFLIFIMFDHLSISFIIFYHFHDFPSSSSFT